jgi:glycosyltransferase involved in cell wall biosynthesis
MHILQINTEKGWRGGERQTLLSMEGLRGAGVRVTLLCLKNKPLFCKAAAAGFTVAGVTGQVGAFFYLLVYGGRYSVLHAQTSRALGVAALATLLVRTPLVFTKRAGFSLRTKLTKIKYRKASALVAVSGAVGKAIVDAGLPYPEIIGDIVMPPHADEKKIAALRQQYRLNGRKVVGVVAALTGEKNPLGMIGAAAVVCLRNTEAVFVHFGDGALMSEAAGRVRYHGIGDRYLFMGFHRDVEELFGMFDVFAMSSLREGLGSSVLDAFAAGVPVASSDAGGLAELVGGRGLLSPKGDAEALAANIITLLDEQKLAADLAATARDYVLKNHHLAILTGKYVEVYKSVVRSQNSVFRRLKTEY